MGHPVVDIINSVHEKPIEIDTLVSDKHGYETK